MTTTIIANLEKLIGTPRDSALLRYSLGSEWLKAGDPAQAAEHLRAALERDADKACGVLAQHIRSTLASVSMLPVVAVGH